MKFVYSDFLDQKLDMGSANSLDREVIGITQAFCPNPAIERVKGDPDGDVPRNPVK